MTEAEWLACDDLTPMLARLRARAKSESGKRKLRLFAVGCCRCIWAKLRDERSRKAVEVAERIADGLASPQEWAHAIEGVRKAREQGGDDYCTPRHMYAEVCLSDNEWSVASSFCFWDEPDDRSGPAPIAILRDVFGNPFRPPRRPERSLLTWNDGVIPKLAQAIYAERAFERLPILADALEDAGCDNGDILAHCRGPGPHVRGCWVVDLLVGKG